ncbi:hypothetical protein REPUB_Repub10bG0049900 [Reevesia pubescens]
MESINGVKEGRWKATLTFYKPMIRDANQPYWEKSKVVEEGAATKYERSCICTRPGRLSLECWDKLVIVDFFSPGCGGCKALHPKICQFAEMNPYVQFLQVWNGF